MRHPRVNLAEPVLLRCTFCKREDSGTLPGLDRAGWDWFRGDFPARVEVCPDCAESNRRGHARLRAAAAGQTHGKDD